MHVKIKGSVMLKDVNFNITRHPDNIQDVKVPGVYNVFQLIHNLNVTILYY